MVVNKVYVETCNFNMFSLEIGKFRGHIDVMKFLEMLDRNLDDEDAFSLYSVCFDEAKRYKITFSSKYDKLNEEMKTHYNFALVDHADGEKEIEVIYEGDSKARMMHLLWGKRVIINKGLDGMC